MCGDRSSIIAWGSQHQTAVALSTTDSEYVAASQTVREIMWLKTLIEELQSPHVLDVTFFMDNQSAMKLVENPVCHKRTKHIDVRYHYIREKYEEKAFNLEYLSTKDRSAGGHTYETAF